MILGAASVLGETVYVAGIGPNIGTFGFNVEDGKKIFESTTQGEYNPVISDGEEIYLTGASTSAPSSPSTAGRSAKRGHRRRRRDGSAASDAPRTSDKRRGKPRRAEPAQAGGYAQPDRDPGVAQVLASPRATVWVP